MGDVCWFEAKSRSIMTVDIILSFWNFCFLLGKQHSTTNALVSLIEIVFVSCLEVHLQLFFLWKADLLTFYLKPLIYITFREISRHEVGYVFCVLWKQEELIGFHEKSNRLIQTKAQFNRSSVGCILHVT